MKSNVLSLFDYSGRWAQPYKEAGHSVKQIDIKKGIDILTWDYEQFNCNMFPIILIAIPCTDYALSGAKHFAAKDADGRTAASDKLVNRTKDILDYFKPKIWALENPMSRIHTLHPWLGKPKLKFNPTDYAGYDPVPDDSRYNKMTWIWGEFTTPEPDRLEPIYKENPGWRNLGGKSERTKELRSNTPLGFSYAFYKFNH